MGFDPALVAFEADAGLRGASHDRSLVPYVGIEIALAGRDGERHAVGVLIVDLKCWGRVVDGVAGRKITLALDGHGAGAFAIVTPLGQIDHVARPSR